MAKKEGELKKDLLFVGEESDRFLINKATKPSITKPERPSALDRVKGFLPILQKANKDLLEKAEKEPEKVDIEHIENESDQVIEMSLALGVFDKEDPDDQDIEKLKLPTDSTKPLIIEEINTEDSDDSEGGSGN